MNYTLKNNYNLHKKLSFVKIMLTMYKNQKKIF